MYPSLHLAHSMQLKDEYSSADTLLDGLKYEEIILGGYLKLQHNCLLVVSQRLLYHVYLLSLPLEEQGSPQHTTTDRTDHRGPISEGRGTTLIGKHIWTHRESIVSST